MPDGAEAGWNVILQVYAAKGTLADDKKLGSEAADIWHSEEFVWGFL